MSLFGYSFKYLLLERTDVYLLHRSLGYCVAEMVDSLEVGTADRRKTVLDSLPQVFEKEQQQKEFQDGAFVKDLYSTFELVKNLLVSFRFGFLHSALRADLYDLYAIDSAAFMGIVSRAFAISLIRVLDCWTSSHSLNSTSIRSAIAQFSPNPTTYPLRIYNYSFILTFRKTDDFGGRRAGKISSKISPNSSMSPSLPSFDSRLLDWPDSIDRSRS